MFMKHETYPAALLELVAEAEGAIKAIPPLFPLASSVAVNPFLGQTHEPLSVTAARLARVAGTRILPDRDLYRTKYAAGDLTDEDLTEARAAMGGTFDRPSLDTLKAAMDVVPETPSALPTIAELAADVSGIDWPGLIVDRIGVWAAGRFVECQSVWRPYRSRG